MLHKSLPSICVSACVSPSIAAQWLGKNPPIVARQRLGEHVTVATNTQSPEELLKWVKDLNPGLHVEHWRVLVRQPEPKGQRLILLIDRDSLTAIKGTGYKIFTGLTQGKVKVLRDPEAGPQKEQATASSPESMESGSGGEGAGRPPPPGQVLLEGVGRWGQLRKYPQLLNLLQQIGGPPLRKPDLLRGR
jgi:hypothetical protein